MMKLGLKRENGLWYLTDINSKEVLFCSDEILDTLVHIAYFKKFFK